MDDKQIRDILRRDLLNSHLLYATLEWMLVHCERMAYCKNISWPALNKAMVQFVAEFLHSRGVSNVLEVFAGRGLLARLLMYEGITVTATDDFSSHGTQDGVTYFRVINQDAASAVSTWSARALMMCWPPYNTAEAFIALSKFSGDYFIYCGEGRWGCNADDAFFDRLSTSWLFVRSFNNPRFPGINDCVCIFVRNRKQPLGVQYADGRLLVDPSPESELEVKVGPSDTLVIIDDDGVSNLMVIPTDEISSDTQEGSETYSYKELVREHLVYF